MVWGEHTFFASSGLSLLRNIDLSTCAKISMSCTVLTSQACTLRLPSHLPPGVISHWAVLVPDSCPWRIYILDGNVASHLTVFAIMLRRS